MLFFGDKAKKIRKSLKLTSEELAKIIGINRTTLSAWENGKWIPSEIKVRSLSRAMRVSADMVSDLEPDKPVSSANFAESLASISYLTSSNHDNYQRKIEALLTGINHINNVLKNEKIIIDALTTSLSSIFYIKDTNMKYILTNHLFQKNILLNKRVSVLNKSDYDFFPGTEAKSNDEEDRQVIISGKPVLNKEAYIPGTRKKKWGLISKIPIVDSEGKIEGLIGSIIDITERKAAEEALHKQKVELEKQNQELNRVHAELEISRAKYYDLYNLAPMGYFTLDQEGSILEANLISSSMLSTMRDSLIGQSFSNYIVPEDKDIYYLHAKRLLSSGVYQEFKIRLLTKDGTIFWVNMTLTPMQHTVDKRSCLATISEKTDTNKRRKI